MESQVKGGFLFFVGYDQPVPRILDVWIMHAGRSYGLSQVYATTDTLLCEDRLLS